MPRSCRRFYAVLAALALVRSRPGFICCLSPSLAFRTAAFRPSRYGRRPSGSVEDVQLARYRQSQSQSQPQPQPQPQHRTRPGGAAHTRLAAENGPDRSLPRFVRAPSPDTKPDYENIHGPFGPLPDRIFLQLFRAQLADKVGVDSKLPRADYRGIIELASALNARYSNRTQIQQVAQSVLRSLFPQWLPKQYAVLFSKPFPHFSARMNAWATKAAGTWLMGECEINDIEIDGKIHKDQGLLVKRCRFLEESGCASVCVNSCKIPTQNFFLQDMGLPLTMTPDYETYECQFAFGQVPDEQSELDARATPCLSRCPTMGGMRQWHSDNMNNNNNNNSQPQQQQQQQQTIYSSSSLRNVKEASSQCQMMDDNDMSVS